MQDRTQEHEKTLEERGEQAKLDKDKAVNMETMKQKAKLGMAENQARAAKAKLEIVETAAKDTPQRPVIEVWEIAKVAKPAPVVAPPTPAKAAAAPAPANAPVSAPAAAQTQSQTPAASAAGTQAALQPSSSTAPVQTADDKMQARQAKFGTPSTSAQPAQGAQGGSFGQPSFTSNGAQGANNADPTQQPASNLPQKPQQSSNAPNQTRAIGGGIPRGGSMLPRGGAAGRGGRGGLPQPAQLQTNQGLSVHGAAGQNQATNQRGGMQSGLPRGGAGGMNARGGRGGRGGGAAGNSGPSSPMNGNARQFVPGNKRSHDGANPQGDEKRARGGGGAEA